MSTIFKVGDWVVPIGEGAVRGTIKQFSRSMEIEQMSHPEHYQQFFKLWKPKQGEWCWFWDISTIQNKYKFPPKLGQFGKYDFSLDYFNFCEPFIGQLPTFLKDS